MRIIAGKNKSRKLLTLEGKNTRPMMDRMKESVFNTIGPFFDGDIVLDLFSGSGALSLEALSRGAKAAYLVEVSKDALRIIKSNISMLKEEENTYLYHMDYQAALNIFKSEAKKFDIVFLDPPYRLNVIEDIVEFLLENDMLSPLGIIVCQYVKGNVLLKEYENLKIIKNYNYASSEVCIFQKKD